MSANSLARCASATVLAFSLAFAAPLGLARAERHEATVQTLALPSGFTIEPEADRRLMAFGAGGAVYAIVTTIEQSVLPNRLVLWSPGRDRQMFAPIPQVEDDRAPAYRPHVQLIAPSGAGAYVTLRRMRSGTTIRDFFAVNRWSAGGVAAWSIPPCAVFGYGSLWDGPHVFAADGPRLALTIDPSAASAGFDMQNPASVEANLPRASIIEGQSCRPLGPVILTSLRGSSAAGYLGYLQGKPSPWTMNLMVQQMHAKAWLKGRERELGPGVAFATSSDGMVVGASALPGHEGEWLYGNFFGPPGGRSEKSMFAVPHATLWTDTHDRSFFLHGDVRSVAWDISDEHVVVGMAKGKDRRHRAFRIANGELAYLDDLPHPPGWRFESAYAVRSDGAIAGVGTLRGVAVGFVWKEAKP